MDRRRTLLYGVAPLAVGALLVALYFSGVPALQTLAAPAHQREYGLVENLQNLVLVGVVVLTLRAARGERGRARLAWRAVAAFSLLVLLEEIDYGNHYWRSLTGAKREPGEHFNLHNQGNLTDWIKAGVDTTALIAFVILPFFVRRLPERWRAWVPSPYSVLTLLVAVSTSKVAHALEDAGVSNNGGLRSNISEFREVGTYWLALLYLGELALRRGALGAGARSEPARSLPADGAARPAEP